MSQVPQFSDEATDLARPDFESRLRHFQIYRSAGDMPNAIQLMDELSDEFYWRVCRSKTIDTRLPSIVAAFMPKSGGTFLFNRLVLFCRYVDYHWAVSHPFAGQSIYAVPRALRNYLDGGCAHHSHFLPTPYNLKALDDAGVRKVWVHVRHPCEVVQSAYYHYAGLGQGEGSGGQFRVEATLREAAMLNIDAEVGNPEKLNAFFRAQLEWVIDWLRMWLSHAEARPEFVYLTSHRDLNDPLQLLRGVFGAFGAPIALDGVLGFVSHDRRRTGHGNDWRDQLDPATIEAATELIKVRLGFSKIARDLCNIA
jgi:hypothetical protein